MEEATPSIQIDSYLKEEGDIEPPTVFIPMNVYEAQAEHWVKQQVGLSRQEKREMARTMKKRMKELALRNPEWVKMVLKVDPTKIVEPEEEKGKEKQEIRTLEKEKEVYTYTYTVKED